MENIYKIFETVGLKVDFEEEQKDKFDKLFHKNYKTVAEVEKANSKIENLDKQIKEWQTKYDEDIKTRDTDLEDLQEKLKNAGADKDTIEKLNTNITDLTAKYEASKKEYEDKLTQQKYEFAIKEKANDYSFSSNSAKKMFIQDAIASQDIKMSDKGLLGFEQFVDSYKENDKEAFKVEETSEEEASEPQFTGKLHSNNEEEEKPKKEIPSIW